MPDVSCPSCGHRFTPAAPSPVPSPELASTGHPEPSVVRWFHSDPSWLGELSTDEVYRGYLRATTESPVSRAHFVADLAYLGIEEVIDDDTPMLVRA